MKRTAVACVLAGLSICEVAAADPVDPRVCIGQAEAGQRVRDQGKYLEARGDFLACAQPQCPAAIQHDCQSWLDQLEPQIPRFVVAARAEGRDVVDVRVSVDGVEIASVLDGAPHPIDPGPHRLRFERKGDPPVEQDLVFRAGERDRRVDVAFGAEPTPAEQQTTGRTPWLAYGLAGLAVVGVGLFTYFAIDGYSTLSQCRSDGPNGSNCKVDSSRSSAETAWHIGDVALGVGLLSAAAATWLFLRRDGHPSSSSGRPTLYVAPSWAGATAGASVDF